MPPLTERNRWQYDLFVTDDFKITPRLTLNLGLRYELHMPWRENSNRTSIFDIGSASIVVPDGATALCEPAIPQELRRDQRGQRGRIPQPHADSAGPEQLRAPAVAYRPCGQQYGVSRRIWHYFDPTTALVGMGGSPYTINEPAYTNPNTGYIVLPTVFPSGGVGAAGSVGLAMSVRPDLQIPYSMQYNFTIERQMWNTGFSVRYMGTNTRQGVWAYNYNSPVPNTTPYVDKPRPLPQYPGFPYRTNGAGHQYNAATVEVKREAARGLMLHSHWTWARDIYDLNDGEQPENPFSRAAERAPAVSIPTHRWVSTPSTRFRLARPPILRELLAFPQSRGRRLGIQHCL
jgi:hypothetical protein